MASTVERTLEHTLDAVLALACSKTLYVYVYIDVWHFICLCVERYAYVLWMQVLALALVKTLWMHFMCVTLYVSFYMCHFMCVTLYVSCVSKDTFEAFDMCISKDTLEALYMCLHSHQPSLDWCKCKNSCLKLQVSFVKEPYVCLDKRAVVDSCDMTFVKTWLMRIIGLSLLSLLSPMISGSFVSLSPMMSGSFVSFEPYD